MMDTFLDYRGEFRALFEHVLTDLCNLDTETNTLASLVGCELSFSQGASTDIPNTVRGQKLEDGGSVCDMNPCWSALS